MLENIYINDESNPVDKHNQDFNYISLNLTYNSQMNDEYLCPKCKKPFSA